MHIGRLIRIILIILILGMGAFLIIRNASLKKQLAAGEITEIGVKDFIPFGSGNGGGLGELIDDILPGGNNEEDQAKTQQKYHLVAENVAGFTIIDRADEIAPPTGKDSSGKDIFETTTAIRYALKENGYVYDYLPKYKKSYLISDTPIPHISFATFSDDGNQILFQYLAKDLVTEKSVLGSLGSGSVSILPDNIISFAFSSNGQFAYVRGTTNGSSFISRNNAGVENIVYSSPLKEWSIQFLGSEILATTKASELSNGFSYIINPNTKTAKRLWGNEKGLTTKTSANGSYILKSNSSAAGPILSLYTVNSGTLLPLNKLGFVEKCSFSKDETILICGIPKSFENKLYPDSWYLGEVQTNDGVAKYTTANLNETVFTDPESQIEDTLDVWQSKTSNAGNISSFINKNNMSLWSYED